MIYTRFNGLLQTEFRLWSACKLADEDLDEDEDEDEDKDEDEVIESCWSLLHYTSGQKLLVNSYKPT